MAVEFRELTSDNYMAVLLLKVAPDQQGLVAANEWSVAQAHFAAHAWFRGIFADDEPVGFIMTDEPPGTDAIGLWRFMIAAESQGKGFGRAALELLVARARKKPGIERVTLTHADESGHAGPFYSALGFAYTGNVYGNEREMELRL